MSEPVIFNLEHLRKAFDQSFAEPQEPEQSAKEAMVVIGAGRERFALPVRHLASVQKQEHIVPVPTSSGNFLGVAAVRGQILPVFSLLALLGRKAKPVRWIAITADQPVALGISAVHHTASVSVESILPASASTEINFIAGLAQIGEELLPVVDVPAILASLKVRGNR